MAALLTKISLLAAGAAAWDDTVALMQRIVAETDDTWADKDKPTLNETFGSHGTHWKLSRQEELLAMGDTGSWCLTDADSHSGVSGCMGTPKGQACTRCVNGMVTCSYGTTPLLDYQGNTYCATPDVKEQCFKKGCVPGGCCQQTCCPPRLAKPMKLLIQDQKDRSLLAATAALKAKEAEVKAISAEIKKENAEFELAKLQAPKVIPRERKAQQEQIKSLEGEIKAKEEHMKKLQAEAPATLEKAKKEHQKQLGDMAEQVQGMAKSLKQIMADPAVQGAEKRQELQLLRQQIRAQEKLLEAQEAQFKDRLEKMRQEEKEGELRFSKKLAADQAELAKARKPAAAMAEKHSGLKASQEQIRALEAELAEAKKQRAGRAAASERKLRELDQNIAHEKLAIKQAAINPMLQTKRGAEKLQAIKGSVARMTEERERLFSSASESRKEEEAKIQRIEKGIDEKRNMQKQLAHVPAATVASTAQQSAKTQMDRDRKEFQMWKEAHSVANSEEARQLKALRSELEAKKTQLQKASLSSLTQAQEQIKAEIVGHGQTVEKARRDFAAEEKQRQQATESQVKEMAAEISDRQRKLQKTKAEVPKILQRRTTGQLSDLSHMLHDIKDKSKVLQVKQIEVDVAKAAIAKKAAGASAASAITKI